MKMASFQNILRNNGLQKVVIHEVENGYGVGASFHVFECSTH